MLHVTRDLTTPLSGMFNSGSFVIRGLALATVNLPTKFEVSNSSTHYKDMKGYAKCRKWGGLR